MSNNVFITNESALQKAIENAIESALKKQLPELVKKATTKPYLTKAELMELTGWSSRTLQHLRSTFQIHFIQHGRKILYPTEEIYEFLEKHHIEPNK